MQKYVYVKSPLKAAQLLEKGFSYIKAPLSGAVPMYIFEASEALLRCVQGSFAVGEDYVVRDGALVNF